MTNNEASAVELSEALESLRVVIKKQLHRKKREREMEKIQRLSAKIVQVSPQPISAQAPEQKAVASHETADRVRKKPEDESVSNDLLLDGGAGSIDREPGHVESHGYLTRMKMWFRARLERSLVYSIFQTFRGMFRK